MKMKKARKGPGQLDRIMRGELENKTVIRKFNGQCRLEERGN